MAITDAQQAKQIMMKKGGPVHRHQLAKKRKDGKRPGYYGLIMDTLLTQEQILVKTTVGTGNITGGGSGGSDQDFDRARRAIDQEQRQNVKEKNERIERKNYKS